MEYAGPREDRTATSQIAGYPCSSSSPVRSTYRRVADIKQNRNDRNNNKPIYHGSVRSFLNYFTIMQSIAIYTGTDKPIKRLSVKAGRSILPARDELNYHFPEGEK
jgi:hypothetical protein